MTMLRDVIDIPERTSDADFVVGLAAGVEDKHRTLETYVVTPQLGECFDQALALVSEALTSGRSQAAFLHGSFGSGKSHFMAVLYQLIRADAEARAVPELGPVVTKHDPVLQGRKVLPLTFHLIGATSLEQAVLRGYVEQVRTHHPDAPLPAVHRSDALLVNADERRAQEGDERFFALLNQAPRSGGFGRMGGGARAAAWDATTYDEARSQQEGEDGRSGLVSDLVRTMFSAFASTDDWVDLDTGLATISRHAKGLGYDAVVLFLDELVLWLASHLSDRAFVSNEGAKLAKLVEAQDARRDAPLVSLISRQRDLAEFLGEHVPGAERAALEDVFGHSRGRIGEIRLEDRNLPVIAERRLLRPRDDDARRQIDAAFDALDRHREDVWDVLLAGGQVHADGTGSDQAAFRRTYPFSPALVATLVAISQALQRERTALKVMLQLLVRGRDELQVGDLVPVGDLFDVLVDTDAQAVTPELGKQFDAARRLYRTKLRQALLDIHQLTDEQASAVDASHQFRTDDRLVKTMLLSALAPDVPALGALTASRLNALNFGTIRTWVAGEEAATVLQKIKAIGAQVGEVSIGEGDDPLISLEISDVDPESVLERARNVDNEGNRRQAMRRLIWESLGVGQRDTLDGVQQEVITWRGRRVVVDLVFGNVRDEHELPTSALLPVEDRWRVVVDYPFDADGQSPLSDQSRVESLQQSLDPVQTLFWIPAFFTRRRLDDLGTLVVLEHLFSGDRFTTYADHLSPADREQVRGMLRQRHQALRERILDSLKQAYGAARRVEADVDLSSALDKPFLTLAAGFAPQAPVGADLRQCLHHLLDQALSFAWPAHPRFEPGDQEVRSADARRVLEHCADALEVEGGRVAVESSQRRLLTRVCNTLEVGRMHEAHLVVTPQTFPWSTRLQQAARRAGQASGTYRVRDLLSYLDEPTTRGLAPATAGLVISVFALMEDLAWWRDGAQVPAPAVDQVTGAYELREPVKPDQADWDAAVVTARDALGVSVPALLNAATLARLTAEVRRKAQDGVAAATELERALHRHADPLGLGNRSSDRARTAAAVRTLLERLRTESDDIALVEALSSVTWPTSAAAARRSLESSKAVANAVERTEWQVVDGLREVGEEWAEEAKGIVGRLEDAARHDDLASSLPSAIATAQREGIDLLRRVTRRPGPGPGPTPPSGSVTVAATDIGTAIEKVRAFAATVPGQRVTVTWTVEP